MDFSQEPITEVLEDGEFTFNRCDKIRKYHAVVVDETVESEFDPYKRIVNHGSNMDSNLSSSSLGTGWCRKCSTSAKMNGSDPKLWERFLYGLKWYSLLTMLL